MIPKSKRTASRNAGFGLAEVLLASGVLILVVASVVALSRFVIRGYSLTASRSQALYLAQEGQESVRNIRDSFWIDNEPETDFQDLSPVVDYDTSWNTVTNRFQLAPADPVGVTLGNNPIPYHRTITIADVTGDPGIDDLLEPHMKRVTVAVRWSEAGRDWVVSTETYLTDWKIEG